jgi:predicted ABC-type ATPase
MELRSVDARPGDRPPDPGQPPRDAARASDARHARVAASENGHARPGQAARSGGGQPGAAPRPAEREPLTALGDAQRLPARPPTRADLGRQRLAERLERAENPVTSRTELRERLSHLEAGHPSSPWQEDGSPRPPTPRLADLERLDPPLSDAAYAAHREVVRGGLKRAVEARLTTGDQFAVDKDEEAWAAERLWVHDEIVAEVYNAAAGIPCERKAVIAGGLGGAGKTTVLEQHAGIDRSSFLTINPDEFKEELARRGLVPDVPGLSPMEASGLVHEESSYIARMLAGRALADGKNVIWDVTLSSPESAAHRVEELRAAGYEHVRGIFVDIPVEASVARAVARHRRGHDRYLAGDGLGGRYVPEDVIRSQADPGHGSINRKAFESIKHQLDYWAIYNNSFEGRPPVLLEEGHRESGSKADEAEELV